jgi:hypothetical protein
MILHAMLQRLYASLVHGPSMNARPHRSRQRCDFMDLAALRGTPAAEALRKLMEDGKVEFPAKVKPFTAPQPELSDSSDKSDALTPDQRAARDAWLAQTRLLKKLRDIAEDATDYLNDHGESCLALGFPLLSMPPHAEEVGTRQAARVLAPLLLVPVELQVRTASRAGVTLSCTGSGAELMVPNPSLLAWLERQTGKQIGELFTDDEAADPWREISELLRQISELLGLPAPAVFTPETLLAPVPAADKLPDTVSVLPGAVLGLFPLSNQSLLRDTRWMEENETALVEPVASFLSPQALQSDGDPSAPEPVENRAREFHSEWYVSPADPCQAGAVLAAREARALVVHGPPGTGKSQTITNMIADHLARRQRVLFVCDKRTALDVVKYRLDAAGLGYLCGVVHDPSADRREFYMSLRERLESLAETPVPADPGTELESVNRQLAALHAELDAARRKLHDAPDGGALSFHELLGTWIDLTLRTEAATVPEGAALTLDHVESARTGLEEIARRAASAGYAGNPLRELHTTDLTGVLTRSPQDIRSAFKTLHEAAQLADGIRDESAAPSSDPVREGPDGLDPSTPLEEQAVRRRAAADLILKLSALPDQEFVQKALQLSPASRQSLAAELDSLRPLLENLGRTAPDRMLLASARSAGVLTPADVNRHLHALTDWKSVAGSFFKRLFSGARKSSAKAALAPLGLTFPGGTEQARAFYEGAKARLLLADLLTRITPSTALPEDAEMGSKLAAAQLAWQAAEAVARASGTQASPLREDGLESRAATLDHEARWAESLGKLISHVSGSGLFRREAVKPLTVRWCSGQSAAADTGAWLEHAATLEDMVRLSAALEQLPASLRGAADSLALKGATAAEMRDAFTRTAVEQELRARMHGDPQLAALDGDRIEAAFNSFLTLSQRKLELVKQAIRRAWLRHQRERLLSSTGTQLGRLGSALRQRLFVKGKRALKLRQMLATGEGTDGGDPLYDLCPVWMASPATVAQIFPRRALFDVVIFDEASQCRLEEALPVLLRGQRVVIAGDQKQLPPTRFFESSLSDSADSDAETAEELFYQQQSDAEDLLTAALNLDVREACLDVHYRSRHQALIGFSNEHFYNSRLQPIPGHPKNRSALAPIRLHRMDGVYEDRANVKEAAAVAELVASLLAEPTPPSIGVACFNLPQRDAILDAFEEKCEADDTFAQRLETARKRQGRDSFEGLFVKNLENVQGDERDVMIISTTFGPDSQGRFRRNFGVLSSAGGGRRLNVLVTRARTAIHVFTSIPAAEYGTIMTAPPGAQPNGRLQLYAYLRYIESLAPGTPAEAADGTQPEVNVWHSAVPSRLAESMGRTLLERHRTGSHIHWGNDGFCVDLACIHPQRPEDVTVGVLADFSRFHKTPDPVEWDLFRTEVLRRQGWELRRVWSPVVFRRHEEVLAGISAAHEAAAKQPAVAPLRPA